MREFRKTERATPPADETMDAIIRKDPGGVTDQRPYLGVCF